MIFGVAVGLEVTEELRENTVVKKERRGYRRGGRVIRFAGVMAAQRPNDEQPS